MLLTMQPNNSEPRSPPEQRTTGRPIERLVPFALLAATVVVYALAALGVWYLWQIL